MFYSFCFHNHAVENLIIMLSDFYVLCLLVGLCMIRTSELISGYVLFGLINNSFAQPGSLAVCTPFPNKIWM